jgi:hypothetical protein
MVALSVLYVQADNTCMMFFQEENWVKSGRDKVADVQIQAHIFGPTRERLLEIVRRGEFVLFHTRVVVEAYVDLVLFCQSIDLRMPRKSSREAFVRQAFCAAGFFGIT